MFKKRSKMVAMLLLIPLLLTGCWDATNVNNLNFSTLVILDRQEEELSLIYEIVKISPAGESGGGGNEDKQVYLTGSGRDFSEARLNLDLQTDKQLFLGTVRTLVVTESAALNDLPEYLFRLREMQEYRQKVSIVILGGDPMALTEVKNEIDQPVGFIIDDTIISAQEQGITCAITTENYVNDILHKRGFVVQHIAIEEKQIRLDGYSVFRDAKIIGFIPIDNSRGMSYLLSNNPTWVYRLPSGERFITSQVKLAHRDIKPYYQHGQIKFKVRLNFEATIQYKSDISLHPLNDRIIQEYSNGLNQVLKQEVVSAIEQSQKQFQCDYLLFGEVFRISYPDAFERMDWLSEYPASEIEISTSVDVSVSEKIDLEGTR